MWRREPHFPLQIAIAAFVVFVRTPAVEASEGGVQTMRASKIKRASELDQNGPVAEFRIQVVADVPVNKEEIIAGTVNIVEPEVETSDFGGIVVLESGTGDQGCTKRVIEGGVDHVTCKAGLGQTDSVDLPLQVYNQGRIGFPLRT